MPQVSVHMSRAGALRTVIASAALLSSLASAQIPDLKLPGNLPGQLTGFGVGMRDAIRKRLGSCNHGVDGTILVCGHRPSYRIDRNVFEAERSARDGGSEYNAYLEARARNPSRGE